MERLTGRKMNALRKIMRGEEPDSDIMVGGGPSKSSSRTIPANLKVGDTWTDSEGKTWKKVGDTAKSRVTVREAAVPLFCPKCKRAMKRQVDTKMFFLKGYCVECDATAVTEARINGTYSEKDEMLRRAKAYYAELRNQVAEALETPEYVLEDGTLQMWSGGPQVSPEKLYADIDEQEALAIKNIEENVR